MNAMAPIERALPYNIEAEQALLGAVLLNNDAYHLVANTIKPEHFSSSEHAEIWKLVKDQIDAGLSANPITLKGYVENRLIAEMSLFQYIVRLTTEAVTVANVKDFACVIVELATRRKLIGMSEWLKEQAYDIEPSKPVKGLLSDIEKEIYQLQDDAPDNDGIGTASSTADKLIKLYEKKEKPRTILLPLPEIRDVLSGDLEAGNLYGLVSSSGEGKTSLAMQIMDYAASNGHPVFFLSYDQSEEQSIMQIACQRLGLDGKRIRNKTLTAQETESYFKELMQIKKLPLQVKNCTRENIIQISSYVKRFLKWNKSDKVPLIVLDHVRKVQPITAGTYEGRIASEIGGMCKSLAKEHGLVWLNIQQRKSMKEGRENPQPYDGDLFGGEQAKEDYDAILYLYRPDKYKDMVMSRNMPEKKREQRLLFFEQWSGRSKLGSLKVRFGDPSIYRPLEFEAQYTRYTSTYQERENELF